MPDVRISHHAVIVAAEIDRDTALADLPSSSHGSRPFIAWTVKCGKQLTVFLIEAEDSDLTAAA